MINIFVKLKNTKIYKINKFDLKKYETTTETNFNVMYNKKKYQKTKKSFFFQYKALKKTELGQFRNLFKWETIHVSASNETKTW